MSRQILLTVHSNLLALPIIVCLGFSACQSETSRKSAKGKETIIESKSIDIEQLRAYLKTSFDSSSTETLVIEGDTLTDLSNFKKAYKANQFQSFWMSHEGITKNVLDYINVLHDIHYDGLDADDYSLDKIEENLASIKAKQDNISSLNAFELLMTQSFFSLSHDMLIGKDTSLRNKKDWKNKNDSLIDISTILLKTIENGDVKEAVDLMRPKHPYYAAFRKEYQRLDSLHQKEAWTKISSLKDSFNVGETNNVIPSLRKRLFIEIGSPADTTSATWLDDLTTALKKFQHLNYVKETGKLDSSTINRLNVGAKAKMKSLALNMERMRWLKHDFPQPYIWVDVPKMELDYVEQDSTQFNMKVVVGRPSRPTTTLDAKLENIVFSPPWIVPPTIMKEEVVPGIARRGGSYLARRGLKAYDRRGRVVNASAINASNYKRFSIGQAPGYRSSLGEVKFNLPNPWSIYLHDTPHREDFVKFYRAYSSGCIRVHHPKQFAEFLLRDTSKYSYNKIDSICKKRTTIFVPLKRQVMVHIVYLTNALDSAGNVMYLKDIYKWDS